MFDWKYFKITLKWFLLACVIRAFWVVFSQQLALTKGGSYFICLCYKEVLGVHSISINKVMLCLLVLKGDFGCSRHSLKWLYICLCYKDVLGGCLPVLQGRFFFGGGWGGGGGLPVFQGSFGCVFTCVKGHFVFVFHQQLTFTRLVCVTRTFCVSPAVSTHQTCLCYKDILCVFHQQLAFTKVILTLFACIKGNVCVCVCATSNQHSPDLGAQCAGQGLLPADCRVLQQEPLWLGTLPGTLEVGHSSPYSTHFALGLMFLLHSFSSLFLFSSPWHQRCFIYQDSAVLFTAC